MPADPARVRAVFLDAADLPAADRAGFLDRACAGDHALRGRVDALLKAHDESGELLAADTPDRTQSLAPDDPPTATVRPGGTGSYHPSADPEAGTVVAGKYKLAEPIGEGGMGAVWMAQQTEPVRRVVAVKLIKAGMDSRAVLARFEAERQALALMDHPNIAKVLDAGATPDGRPYFVMELVKGVPITQYCDDRKLTPRQRLELFVPVCQAVQHAHQKGVIHRDLKPSNVLVALYDDRPVPKVIDFGVAKAAGQPLTDHTLLTGFGAVVGTPEYMSPEQASFNQLDVDTRSDIYSLGVLLYELLTGVTPVDRKSLGKAALLEVLRVVREVEAPRPSAKLSTLDTLPSVAANRGTEPAKLSRLMRGELDWVVLKALEKDRAQRYDTANGLARDIQRYLADEVVEARPPSTGYRVRKFVRRHKGQVAAAGLVLVALLTGIAGTTWQAVRATAAEGRTAEQLGRTREAEAAAVAEAAKARAAEGVAVEREQREAAARREADDQRKAAAEKAAAATAAKEFLQSVLIQGDPRRATKDRAVDPNRTLRSALDFAEKDIERRFAGQPAIAADLRTTIGQAYQHLGGEAAAERHLVAALALWERARGPAHPDTLRCAVLLGELYRLKGDLGAAESLLKRALAGQEAALGPDHPDTLTAANTLAGVYWARGDLGAAEPLLKRALAGYEKAVGPDHPETLRLTNNLASHYRLKGDLTTAERLFRRGLAGLEAAVGPRHPDTLNTANSLARVYWARGDLGAAEPLLRRALAGREAVLGPDHPDTLRAAGNLGMVLAESGRPAEAVPLLERAHAARDGHPSLAEYGTQLADAYAAAGRPADAARMIGGQLAEARKVVPPGSPALAGLLTTAGARLLELDPAAAEPVLRESVGLWERRAPPGVWVTAATRSLLGDALLRRGKPAEAEPLLLAGYEGLLADRKNIPPAGANVLPDAADRLVELYERLGQPDEVKRWRAERQKYPFVAPPPRPVVR